MPSFSRSPLVWITATVISGLLYFFAFNFFPQTFPLIHLDITMNLTQALEQADIIAKKNNLEPSEHNTAALFHTDTPVKTFVELEAGGKDALVNMMKEQLYMPYTWFVRHFRENEKNEHSIIFTPNGTPYGFFSILSENLPGPQLQQADARTIAETDATQKWNIDFTNYALVEASAKMQPSKRIDHTFVYERTDTKIGEGLYRLKIVISGDKISELIHFVKVPESFTRRYAEMRSANHVVSWTSGLLMILLYIIGGCCLGLYWLTRKRWTILKQPLLWGLCLSFSSLLVSINQLPMLWMNYHTAFSAHNFLMMLFIQFFIHFLWHALSISIVVTTAESLTRRAFGHHPQLWSLWLTENATSYATVGRVFGSYLMVGFNCAFVIAFYLFSTRYLNWWTPSEVLFDPNILATYVPWFSPLIKSLNAGFVEECLYRAIPLAGAALLGTYFGKRNWFIAIACILQALVFGAAHAHYATQPSYARLIELFIPSLIWAGVYLRFGLLPTILTHTLYDIIWFSLPIFVSHAPQAFWYKIVIILASLLPLLYCIYARIRKGHWTYLSQSALNTAWQPTVITEPVYEQPVTTGKVETLSWKSKNLIFCLGILSLITWLWTTPFVHDCLTITLNRSQAIAQTNNFLQKKNITLTEPWKTLPLTFTDYKFLPHIKTQHAFIWKEGGKELYHSLLGAYLQPAHWTIRYAQFDTDIIQSAEEYKIMLFNNDIWQYYHQLPETREGAQLNQEQARVIAHNTLKNQFNLDPAKVIEISAEQSQLPSRIDWLFIFSNPSVLPLEEGQARIAIVIAGDEVTNAVRTIHVPEEWERSEQNKQQALHIMSLILFLILSLLLLFAACLAFYTNKETVPTNRFFFLIVLIPTTVTTLIYSANVWPSITASFNTINPFMHQAFQSITFLLFGALIKIFLYTFAITFVSNQNKTHSLPNNLITNILGICVGLIFAALLSIAHKLIPDHMPLWPCYDALIGYSSLFATFTMAITHYIQVTILFLALFLIVDRATLGWKKHQMLFYLIAGLCGTSMITLSSIELLPLWAIVGVIIGLIMIALYRYIIRYDYAMIPLATLSFSALQIIRQGHFNAYPNAWIEAIISLIIIIIIANSWYIYLSKSKC